MTDELRWYTKPGGSAHAFEGVHTLCRRFWWQASWQPATETDDRCPVCIALVEPPLEGHTTDRPAMTERELIAAYGGLPSE